MLERCVFRVRVRVRVRVRIPLLERCVFLTNVSMVRWRRHRVGPRLYKSNRENFKWVARVIPRMRLSSQP